MSFNCHCIILDIVQRAGGVSVPVGEYEAMLIDRSVSRVARIHQTLVLIKYLRQAEGWIDSLSHSSLT